MHLHRVALILVIAAITCEVSWADMQCNTAVMDIHMKNCNRAKRNSENVDIQTLDEETKQITKRDNVIGKDKKKCNLFIFNRIRITATIIRYIFISE